LRRDIGLEDETQFVMLEMRNEYAQERLETSGEADELRRRRAECFLALAGRQCVGADFPR